MLGRLIALFDHASHHREEGFVQRLARSRHLLRDLFAIGIGVDQLLKAAQLSFDPSQPGAQGALLVCINDSAPGVIRWVEVFGFCRCS